MSQIGFYLIFTVLSVRRELKTFNYGAGTFGCHDVVGLLPQLGPSLDATPFGNVPKFYTAIAGRWGHKLGRPVEGDTQDGCSVTIEEYIFKGCPIDNLECHVRRSGADQIALLAHIDASHVWMKKRAMLFGGIKATKVFYQKMSIRCLYKITWIVIPIGSTNWYIFPAAAYQARVISIL